MFSNGMGVNRDSQLPCFCFFRVNLGSEMCDARPRISKCKRAEMVLQCLVMLDNDYVHEDQSETRLSERKESF